MKDDIFYKFIFRFTGDLIIFFSVLFCPWWITVALVFFAVIFFNNFIEAFFAGLLIDALYGTPDSLLFGFRLFFSFAFFVLWLFATLIKRKVRIFEV